MLSPLSALNRSLSALTSAPPFSPLRGAMRLATSVAPLPPRLSGGSGEGGGRGKGPGRHYPQAGSMWLASALR